MDKVDTYDKEQLQAMGWLFDETETPDTAVRFVEQDLTSEQQMQVFKNLGWKVHVIPQSAINSTDAVSDDEKEARLAATALLVQETGEMYIYGHNSSSAPSDRRFFRFRDTKTLALLNVVTTTGLITQPLFVNIYDENAVSFNIDQSNVSNDKKNQALGNIGIDFVRLPYSLLNTTLSDEMFAVLDNARGIILVDTPSNYDNPTVFIKGINTSTACHFVSHNTGTTYCQIKLNKSTKIVSSVSAGLTYAGSVRYAETQNLTTLQQNTALSNIGSGLFVLDIENGQATLTDAQEARLLSCKGVILRGTVNAGKEVLTKIYYSDYQEGDQVSFWAVRNNRYILQCVYTKSTKLFRFLTSASFIDPNAVSIKAQTLNAAEQAQARNNIGVQSAAELLADDDFIAQLKTKLGL